MATPPPNDSSAGERKPSWWRRPGCLLLLASGLLILAAFFAFCIYVPPLRISEETTRITGPLTPDGQIDFLKHLEETTYPPEMKTDDNGFRLFLRTFGDISDSRGNEFYRTQKYVKLGLDPNEKPTMTMPEEPYKIISEYFKQKGEPEPEQARDLCGKPWTVEELPMLADWLAEIDGPLDAVAEMVRKPVFCFPLLESLEAVQTGQPQNMLDGDISDILMVRSVARQFQVRANFRIAKGDIDGAIDDTTTIFRLARKVGVDGIIIQRLVALAIEGVAHAIPVAGNQDSQLARKQVKRLHEAFEALPPIPPPSHAYEWERCMALSATQLVLDGEKYSLFSGPLSPLKLGVRRCNKNVVYRHVNSAYDTLSGRLPRSELSRFESPPDAKTIALSLPTTFGRGKLAGMSMTALLLPAVNAFEEAIRRSECVLNMKRLTLALLMYKAEHGEFPREDWFERIKPYLGEEPERYLRCPSCSSTHAGTNYALILHEKEPENSDTFLLVELREPVPPEKAFFTPEEALSKFSGIRTTSQIGSQHPGCLNTARRNGAVSTHMQTVTGNDKELHRLLGLENELRPAVAECNE